MDSPFPATGGATTTLRIANLPDDFGREDVRKLVAAYGAAERIRLTPPRQGVRAVGFFDIASESAAEAVAGLDGRECQGGVLSASLVAETATPVGSWPRSGTQSDTTGEAPVPSILVRHCYQVASVERAELEGAEGQDWYRYVLASGRSLITGFRRGSLDEVTEYAQTCAEAFNLRSLTGKGSKATGITAKK
jgi:hypothetical protein